MKLSAFIRSAPKRGPRVAVLDIETFPQLSYHFGMRNINIGLDCMVEPTTLLSVAASWLNSDDVFYEDVRYGRKYARAVRDDARLAETCWSLMDSADFIVAHNGKGFDRRKINARCAVHGLGPYSQLQVIDTYHLNKAQFGFDSQRLGYVTGVVGDESKSTHAKFPGMQLHLQCLANNPEAFDECAAYNKQDVLSNKSMYLALRGWYERHPNLGPFVENEGEPVCPNCGGRHLAPSPQPHRTQVGIYNGYVCGDCGARPRGRVLIANRAARSHITTS